MVPLSSRRRRTQTAAEELEGGRVRSAGRAARAKASSTGAGGAEDIANAAFVARSSAAEIVPSWPAKSGTRTPKSPFSIRAAAETSDSGNIGGGSAARTRRPNSAASTSATASAATTCHCRTAIGARRGAVGAAAITAAPLTPSSPTAWTRYAGAAPPRSGTLGSFIAPAAMAPPPPRSTGPSRPASDLTPITRAASTTTG